MNRTPVRFKLDKHSVDYNETANGFIINTDRLPDKLMAALSGVGASVRKHRRGFYVPA